MTRAARAAAIALLAGCAGAPALLLGGCALPAAPTPGPPAAPSPAALLLARADDLLARGDYEGAQAAYGEFARQYADDSAAPRALATREVLSALATANRDVRRLSAEALRLRDQTLNAERDLERFRRDLGARENELARMRVELADRQAELGRLFTEAERLRTDLEKLKSVDLRLERRR